MAGERDLDRPLERGDRLRLRGDALRRRSLLRERDRDRERDRERTGEREREPAARRQGGRGGSLLCSSLQMAQLVSRARGQEDGKGVHAGWEGAGRG